MMRALIQFFAFCCASVLAFADVKIGDMAPDFTLTDVKGKEVSLSDFKGQTVVLEWANPYCPFVVKFYDAGAMQQFQSKAKSEGVVWLTINSTADGHKEFKDAAASMDWAKEKGVQAQHWLLDPSGEVASAYGAARTPHMYVINAEGKLAYQGAIDSIRSADSKDIAKADNYVKMALADLAAGKEVGVPQTRPYGCSIKQ